MYRVERVMADDERHDGDVGRGALPVEGNEDGAAQVQDNTALLLMLLTEQQEAMHIQQEEN